MALWGNNDNVGAAGSVTLNYATKTVSGPAGTGSLGPLFGESGNVQEGDVISFGVKTKPGVFFGDAVVVSIASTTSLTIGSTAGLSGAAIAATTFQVSQQPKFMSQDSQYSEANSDYSSHVYGVSGTLAEEAQGGQYATSAGWVGVTTYTDTDGNLRVKKEVIVAMSGISTGNTPHYPKIATAN
jgi:hypothetical protein